MPSRSVSGDDRPPRRFLMIFNQLLANCSSGNGRPQELAPYHLSLAIIFGQMSPPHAPPGDGPVKKFPDFVPPTKIQYLGDGATRLHLRRCRIVVPMLDGTDREHEYAFEKSEIRVGAMDDNDLVVQDDTVSRYHCK